MIRSAVEVLQAILDHPKDRQHPILDIARRDLCVAQQSGAQTVQALARNGGGAGGDRQDARRRRALLGRRGLRAEDRVRFQRACGDVRWLALSVGRARQAGDLDLLGLCPRDRRIQVGRTFQLDELGDAHRCIEENTTGGKIGVLTS